MCWLSIYVFIIYMYIYASLDLNELSAWKTISPRHYTGQPRPRGGGEMRPCGELKLATRALFGRLYVTEGGCLFGVG